MFKKILIFFCFIILSIELTGCMNNIIYKEDNRGAFNYADEEYRQIKIGKKEITLPISYIDMRNLGYDFKDTDDKNIMLEGLKYSPQITFIDKKGNEIYVQFINRSPEEKRINTGEIFSIEIYDGDINKDVLYKDITFGMSKEDVRNIIQKSPEREYINELETGYTSDIWYMTGELDNYKVGGKITITYHDDVVSNISVNCSYNID